MVIKVMVADDQALIRESLKIILSAHPDIEVVATVEDGNHVLSSIPQTHPDLILMDIRMPGMDGVLATKEVKEHYPDIKIIILTTFDDDEFIYSALKYGASGYLLKGASTEELYEAIKVVYQGGAMINPNIARTCINADMEYGRLLFPPIKTRAHTEHNKETNPPTKMLSLQFHSVFPLEKSRLVTPVWTDQIANCVRSRRFNFAKIVDK